MSARIEAEKSPQTGFWICVSTPDTYGSLRISREDLVEVVRIGGALVRESLPTWLERTDISALLGSAVVKLLWDLSCTGHERQCAKCEAYTIDPVCLNWETDHGHVEGCELFAIVKATRS